MKPTLTSAPRRPRSVVPGASPTQLLALEHDEERQGQSVVVGPPTNLVDGADPRRSRPKATHVRWVPELAAEAAPLSNLS